MRLFDVLPSHERWEKAREGYHRTVTCCKEHYNDYYKWYYSRMQQLLNDNPHLFEVDVVVDPHYQLEEVN